MRLGNAVLTRVVETSFEPGVEMFGHTPERAWSDHADLLVLAVKPQNLSLLLPQLRGRLRPEAVVLSIVAGATVGAITRGLGHEAVVRCMPNLPCRIREGTTVWYAAPDAPED